MTMLALDHLIFGNGHGLSSPYFSGRFYWLVDTSDERRCADLYTHMSGFGAQLHSWQWAHPRAGEVRRLVGRDFRPLHSSRRFGRVEIAWCTKLPDNIDAANLELRRLERDIKDGLIDYPTPWPEAEVRA